MSALVVTAAGSGQGKTLVTLALCKTLRNAGIRVQPYKIGPDYIDARFYERVAGRPAYNVDLWLDGPDGVRANVAATCGDARVLVFEGMMGLFDGATDGTGSTADVAALLDASVVAVVDCGASSQTAAAVAFGLRAFDPRLRFAGAVLNRIAGDDHERAVRDACARAGIPVLATVRTDAAYAAAERRLGLDPQAVVRREGAVDALAARLGAALDLHALLQAPSMTRTLASTAAIQPPTARRARIAYADDDAFWFTYAETLEALRAAGADLTPFSPLRDDALPAGTQGVWLGGGYPEEHAPELAANVAMRASLRGALRAGVPAYAECGGLMYLAESLETPSGTYAMAGALAGSTSMREPRLHIGYRRARVLADTPLDPAAALVKGYEFHFASAALREPVGAYAWDGSVERDGALRGNVVAAFLHRHFLPGCLAPARFVAACAARESP